MPTRTKTAIAADFQATAEKERSVALGLEANGRQDPGGHLKLLHLWPGQTPPPPGAAERLNFRR